MLNAGLRNGVCLGFFLVGAKGALLIFVGLSGKLTKSRLISHDFYHLAGAISPKATPGHAYGGAACKTKL